jgi:Peptidase family C50
VSLSLSLDLRCYWRILSEALDCSEACTCSRCRGLVNRVESLRVLQPLPSVLDPSYLILPAALHVPNLRRVMSHTYVISCSSRHQVHDPHGVALNYLIGGADYVIANLWDVTDKDIDKLSMECMRTFFSRDREHGSCSSSSSTDRHVEGNSNTSNQSTSHSEHLSAATLSGALASSRTVCKLKNAVGCAPVVYGLPKVALTRKPEMK